MRFVDVAAKLPVFTFLMVSGRSNDCRLEKVTRGWSYLYGRREIELNIVNDEIPLEIQFYVKHQGPDESFFLSMSCLILMARQRD